MIPNLANAPFRVSKTSSSPLTTGTLLNYTGSLWLFASGRVSAAIQAQATTVKLSAQPDALAAVDLCTTKDINSFGVGSLITFSGTLADAALATTLIGIAESQAKPWHLTCTASGIVTVTFGAASTGAIAWEFLWVPISGNASLLPA